jgi:hypothetical protein
VPVEGGTALLIDESYNANPASMAATLATLALEPVTGRRLAVLGTMRELGEHGEAAHAGLAEPILAANVSELILVGEEMAALERALGGRLPLVRVADAAAATDALRQRLAAGDAVLVKASNGVGLASLVSQMAGGRRDMLYLIAEYLGFPASSTWFATSASGRPPRPRPRLPSPAARALVHQLLRVRQGKGQPIRADGRRPTSPSAAPPPWAGSLFWSRSA